MAEQDTPRALIKRLLRGEPLPRALLMPIIFSLGSRLENVGLREFQANPTKIANALHQIRASLKVDGLACCFDPLLEAEALGGKREWQPDGSCVLAAGSFSGVADLRQKAGPLEALSRKAQVRVTCDVLQRLKVMLKDEPALMVGVTGPYTLAAQLWRENPLESSAADLPQDLVEFGSEVAAAVVKSFLEAGADILLFRETSLPEMTAARYEWWAGLLAPILNVIQFYEALPVLLLSSSAAASNELRSVLSGSWAGTWCPLLGENPGHWETWRSHATALSLGLPANLCTGIDIATQMGSIKRLVAREKPWLLTSTGDLPANADIKSVAIVLAKLREAVLESSTV